MMFLLWLFAQGIYAQTILIPEDATWKYLDDGTDQDTSWQEISFVDTTWASGPAELGYGDNDEATVLSFGSDLDNKYITYYFRHEFVVSDTVSANYLLLRVQRDDGVVVYLNGDEVCRSNMTSDTINYLTFASGTVSGDDEDRFFEFIIPFSILTDTNLLAAEIHQTNLTSSDISFNLELSTTELPQFHKLPYLLYAGNNTEMKVLWQLYESCPGFLSWGTDTNYSLGNEAASEFGSDHRYLYTITGLTPSTKYYYRVVTGTDTIDGHFRTAPDLAADEVTFFAYGDTRTYPADHDDVAERMLLNYAADPQAQAIIIMSADLVSDGNDENIWDEQLFSPDYDNIRELFRTIPILSAKGNHEGTGLIFKKYFPYPYYTTESFYWSFDYGPAHICVIDQYTSYSVGSDQYNWIVADLANSTKLWNFLLFHEPGWSAGGGHENSTTVQEVLQPLCLEYGVQFVINGHNHYYSRAEVGGMEHITTGGGGAPLRTPDPDYPNIVATSSSHHFCKIHIQADTLHFTAIMDDGTVIESFDYYNYNEWAGTIDSDWNDPLNWSKGTVPGEGWNVMIPAGVTNYPQVVDLVDCRNLKIESGALLSIPGGGTLNVNGYIENEGSLDIEDGGIVNQME